MTNIIEKKREDAKIKYEREIRKLEEYKSKLKEAELTDNFRLIEINKKRINNSLQKLIIYSSFIEFVRETNLEDDIERVWALTEFPKIIRNTIPDNIPIVFHGSSNIGIILEIIKTGGLLTPKQRGVSETSFATQIDVTYKNDISASCEHADLGSYSFMPYGAIFAFLPLESEVEKVLATDKNCEVQGGVDGVNFREEPNRLAGIITTKENKERVQAWCLEYHWDAQKVFTHEEFISKCREMFSIEQEQHKSL